MKDRILEVPNEELLARVREFLDKGESVRINVKGRSMRPTFIEGRDSIVISPVADTNSLKEGDVVLFDRGDNVCVHRIVRRSGDRLVIRGDGNSFNALEKVGVDAVWGLVTGGTYRGGRNFTADNPGWRRNTRIVMKYARPIAACHRIGRIVRSYPLSILMLAGTLYLSFSNPSGKVGKALFGILNDKTAHFIMYFCLSSVFWLEWLKAHRRRPDFRKVVFFCVVVPILLGGLTELAQSYLTVSRKGDWLDFCADIGGVLSASLLAFLFYRVFSKRRKI